MSRSYGTRKKFVHFFGGLKSAAIKLTEPTALWRIENLWVMDRVLNLRQVCTRPRDKFVIFRPHFYCVQLKITGIFHAFRFKRFK